MSQFLLSALAVVCPSCDGYNPPHAATCAQCGSATQEGGAARGAAPAAPPAARAAAVASFPGRTGTAPSVPRPPAADLVPPGLKPSARTPPPSAALGHRPVGPPPAARPPAGPPASARPPSGPAGPAPVLRPATSPGVPAAGAARPPTGSVPAAAPSRFGVSVLAGSARGQRFRLPATGCVVGRSRGAILFADDAFLSPLHTTFIVRDGGLFVRDEGSVSGVFVTIAGTEPLVRGTMFAVGGRLFRFRGLLEPAPVQPGKPVPYGAPVPPGSALFGVEEVLVGGRSGRAVVTGGQLLTIGQANCDLSYAGDEGLAGRHCEVSVSPAGGLLRDLSGGLGTFVRIVPQVERPLRAGDRVRLGTHVLQVEALA